MYADNLLLPYFYHLLLHILGFSIPFLTIPYRSYCPRKGKRAFALPAAVASPALTTRLPTGFSRGSALGRLADLRVFSSTILQNPQPRADSPTIYSART